MTQLYIFRDGIIHEATEKEFAEWEGKIAPAQRCALGLRIRHDRVGETDVTTFFSGTPLGFNTDAEPFLWCTLAAGGGLWLAQRALTLESAQKVHERMISMVRGEIANQN